MNLLFKRTAVAFLSCLLLRCLAPSRQLYIQLQYGDEYEITPGHKEIGFIGNAEDGYGQLAWNNKGSLSIQRMDTAMHMVQEQTFGSVMIAENPNDLRLVKMGGKHYWIYCGYDRGTKVNSLLAQEIDLKSRGNRQAMPNRWSPPLCPRFSSTPVSSHIISGNSRFLMTAAGCWLCTGRRHLIQDITCPMYSRLLFSIRT